jgi:hypothetical protein
LGADDKVIRCGRISYRLTPLVLRKAVPCRAQDVKDW